MINQNEINPYIRVAMHSILKTGIQIKKRIIFDYELIYIEKGSMTFCYNGVNYSIGKGKFIFIRPGISHSFTNICSLYQPHIHFDFTYSQKSEITPVCFSDMPDLSDGEKQLVSKDLFCGYSLTPFVVFKDTKKALSLFFCAIDAYINKNLLLAKGYLTALLSMLICDNFERALIQTENSYGISRQILDVIDSEQGLNYSLYDFEKHFSYSKFYLEKQFKITYGIGIIAYQNEKKLKKAAKMLKENTVSETAGALGYSSIYSFSRAFKNKYGVCPSEFKKCADS